MRNAITLIVALTLILTLAAYGRDVSRSRARGAGDYPREGFTSFSVTGAFFHMGGAWFEEFGGGAIPVGTSDGYMIGPVYIGGAFVYNIGFGDYKGTGAVYSDTRIFILPSAKMSPYVSVRPGYFFQNEGGLSVAIGGGVDMRMSDNFGWYAEVDYAGSSVEFWDEDVWRDWLSTIGFIGGVAITL